MIKIALIALSTILVSLVITYSWFNRDSDRVVLTLVTAMTLGALGFITKESISNKIEIFSLDFPVAVFYGLPNYRPLNIKLPYSFDLSMATQNINPDDIPDDDNEHVDIGFGSDIYFDAIQYSVFKTIFNSFSHGWNVKAKRTSTPGGESLTWQNFNDDGYEITITDFIDAHIPNNYFFKLGLQKDIPKPFGGKAMFPPGTQITAERDENDTFLKITFTTKYITLNIKISKSTSSIGIGEYSKSFGMSSTIVAGAHSENNKIGHSVYTFEISGKQTYMLNGHPEMKKHRNWANSITEILETTYSYNLIREDHMRQIQLYGHEAVRGI